MFSMTSDQFFCNVIIELLKIMFWPFKVIDFGTNQKCVCEFDFLLVQHSNVGPILHHLDVAGFLFSWHHPYSTLILEVFPLHQITRVGVNVIIIMFVYYTEWIGLIYSEVSW